MQISMILSIIPIVSCSLTASVQPSFMASAPLSSATANSSPKILLIERSDNSSLAEIQQLSNVQSGLLYNVQVLLGSNKVPFQLDIDTGSSDTFVRGLQCNNPQGDGSCVEARFDPSTDPTIINLNKTWTTQYGLGNVTGNIYNITLSMPGADGNVTFPIGVSTTLNGQSGSDGILGLGFNTISRISQALGQKSASFLDAMEYNVTENVFGIYLSSINNGELSLGGYDTSKLNGTPIYYDIPRPFKEWSIDISSASFSVPSHEPISLATSKLSTAVFDSGSSAIFLPSNVASQLNAWIGATPTTQTSAIQAYTISCASIKSGPLISLKLGSTIFEISSGLYVYKTTAGVCQSMFYGGAESLGHVILGDTFMQGYYTVFDRSRGRIGVAALKDGPQMRSSAMDYSNGYLVVFLGFSFLVLM